MHAPIGILGGTFDPIHKGHLEIAEHAHQVFNFDRILFIPCKRPLLKDIPKASQEARIAMLQCALAPYPFFQYDLRELNRKTPSYTIETAKTLRKDFPNHPLVLILGYDLLSTLHQWHQWGSLLKYTHLLVIHRPLAQQPLLPIVRTFIEKHTTNDPKRFHQKINGNIFFESTFISPISSTEIRTHLKQGKNVEHWLPSQVADYIKMHGLYR